MAAMLRLDTVALAARTSSSVGIGSAAPSVGPPASEMLRQADGGDASLAAVCATAVEAAVADAERAGAPVRTPQLSAAGASGERRAGHAKSARKRLKGCMEAVASGEDAGAALVEAATLLVAFGPGVRGPALDVEKAVIAALAAENADVDAAVECLKALPLALAEGRGPFCDRLGLALVEFGSWVSASTMDEGLADSAGFEPPLAGFGAAGGMAPQVRFLACHIPRVFCH